MCGPDWVGVDERKVGGKKKSRPNDVAEVTST